MIPRARPVSTPRHFRSLFLSDLHLGALACRPQAVLGFLENHDADHIYLVGDILDVWHPLRPVWSERHDAVVDLLRRRASAGASVHYLFGNHDGAMARPSEQARLGLDFLTVAPEVTHVGADGRRYLVLHGDVVDVRPLRWSVITRLGSRVDGLLRGIDGRLRALRGVAVKPESTFIDMLIGGVNRITYAGQAHERRLVALARASDHGGVICGHFHIPALHDDHGILYANCGDWVDSMTALAETADGSLQLLQYAARGSAATAARGAADPVGSEARSATERGR
jgi:UDP-2,3-diacylglucosamine pyrophosphatase LpxH